MTIAFITTEYITEKNFAGGLSNYLYKIAIALKKREVKPVIIVSSEIEEKIVHDNIEVYRVNIRYNKLIVFFLTKILRNLFKINLYTAYKFISQSYQLNRKLRKISKYEKIDLVQYSSYMATGLFRVKKIPAIVRISSLEALWRNAYNDHFDVNKDTNLTIQNLDDYLEIKALKKANLIFGPSKYIGDKVGQICNTQVKIIESPYLPTEFKKDYSFFEEFLLGKKYLLFYGAFGTMKGVHNIAKILYPLFKNHPDLYFVFIGKDRGYKNRTMIEFVQHSAGEFQNRIIYSSQLSHDKLYPIIENSYALVLPSRVDNLPNTCIEGFSMKKIVLGTKGASFEQLINDGINGFLCNIEDPENLLKKIEEMLKLDPERKKIIEENAFKRLELMSPDKITEELLELYNSVISNKINF